MPATDADHAQRAFAPKSYESVLQILKSLPGQKLQGVRLEINAEFFGTAWAASDECPGPRIVGIISKWKVHNAVLMVKWDGWSTNRQTPLEVLDTDSDGMSLKLKLLPYANGDPPPELVEGEQTTAGAGRGCRGRGGAGRGRGGNEARDDVDPDDDDDETANEVECHGPRSGRLHSRRVSSTTRAPYRASSLP